MLYYVSLILQTVFNVCQVYWASKILFMILRKYRHLLKTLNDYSMLLQVGSFSVKPKLFNYL